MSLDLFRQCRFGTEPCLSNKKDETNTLEQNLLHIEDYFDSREKSREKSSSPYCTTEYRESLLVEETLDLLPEIEVDLSLHQCIQFLFGLGE